MSTFTVETKFARRVPDPVLGATAQRHILFVPVEKMPTGFPRDPNPRLPRINRSIWRDIKKHLLNEEGTPNTFHLKNKGITVLAQAVNKLDDDRYELVFEPGDGILDGGHTYELVSETQGTIRERIAAGEDLQQFAKLEVLTGVPSALAVEVAGGLNTAIQVQQFALENQRESFNWIRDELQSEPYAKMIAFKEGEECPYDVRDILVLLELFNISDFPNKGSEFPQRACLNKANVLDNFVAQPEHYEVLRPILKDILSLHDLVQLEARARHNKAGGRAGALSFFEGDEDKGTSFDFHFIGKSAPYKMTKAALFPMLGAFRWLVRMNDTTGTAEWDGGFAFVRQVLTATAQELMRETKESYEDNKRQVIALGRSRAHWRALYGIVREEAANLR